MNRRYEGFESTIDEINDMYYHEMLERQILQIIDAVDCEFNVDEAERNIVL